MKDSRYEEALERARAGMPIDEVFPELKESGDERIRKELLEEIEFIIPHDDETDSEGLILPSYHARIDRYKSYLEKQKEQQPLRDGEIEDRKRDIVAAIRRCYPADYAEYLTSFLKGLSPEDNSEDEYGQEMLGIAYKLMYEHIPENLRTQEFWDSLKFMREYTGKVAIIHSYEKPAEWSEEDDALLKEIVSFFKDGTVKLQHDLDLYAGFLEKKFKSLRPQSIQDKFDEAMHVADKFEEGYKAGVYDTKAKSWKPSEEQMSALEYFIRSWGESGTMSPQNPTLCAAKTLLNDLKSL